MWFFFLRMCACICVCRCTCVAVCMEVRAWHFCRQCLSLNLELTDPAILAVQQALVGTSCLHLPSPGLQACTTMPVIKKKDVFSFQFCDVSVCRYVRQGIGVQDLRRAPEGVGSTRSWSYRCLSVRRECCDLGLSSLEEQQVLLSDCSLSSTRAWPCPWG